MITDRTQADVDNVTLSSTTPQKGAYNYTDLNRVEAKVKELNDLLVTYNYMSALTTKLNWTYTDKFTPSDSTRYLNNVSAIRSALARYSTTPSVPNTMANLTYQKANDIEKILVDIETLLISMENWFVYSGVSNSGQRRLWQNRFRHYFASPSYDDGDYLSTETGDVLTTENGAELEVEVALYLAENGDFIVTQDNNNWEVE